MELTHEEEEEETESTASALTTQPTGKEPIPPTTSKQSPCPPVKLPIINRQPNLSPFVEEEITEEGGLHEPAPVDMIKPQAAPEQAWSKPTGNQRTSVASFQSFRSTAGLTQVAPSGEMTAAPQQETERPATNLSIFVGSDPTNLAAHEEAQPRRKKAKCVIA